MMWNSLNSLNALAIARGDIYTYSIIVFWKMDYRRILKKQWIKIHLLLETIWSQADKWPGQRSLSFLYSVIPRQVPPESLFNIFFFFLLLATFSFFLSSQKKKPRLCIAWVEFWVGLPNSERFVNPFYPHCTVGTHESTFCERSNSPYVIVII